MLHWRLKIREAREAISAGRYEDAYTLLSDAELREYLPAQRLADKLAARYTSRAAQRLQLGQSSAGFADLAAVDRLGGSANQADQVRHDYAERAEAESAGRLAAADPSAALQRLERAARHGVESPEIRRLTAIGAAWQDALNHADAGHMLRAESALERARASSTVGASKADKAVTMKLDAALRQLHQRAERLQQCRDKLQRAAIAKDWSAVLHHADEAVALAPRDAGLCGLRRRAWRELELDKTRPLEPRHASDAMENQAHPGGDAQRLARAIRDSTQHGGAKQDTAVGRASAPRRMLWVDSVGGFLMLADDQVVLGQPAGGASPDLPILADLSRRHAVLRREGGAYVLDPVGPTRLDGKPIEGPTVLTHRHEITLGESVRLQFERPHALSATARLTVTSGHRTAPAADAVLLMAESCVLGPRAHSHLVCRGLEQDVILFRQGDGLACRTGGPLSVDGAAVEGAAPIGDGCRIEGQDFSLSLEHV